MVELRLVTRVMTGPRIRLAGSASAIMGGLDMEQEAVATNSIRVKTHRMKTLRCFRFIGSNADPLNSVHHKLWQSYNKSIRA